MNELKGQFEKIFSDYYDNYVKIFKVLYPSKSSTGFTERNLSVNFAKAYESANQESVTWYEFPIIPIDEQASKKRNWHYDAVIVNPDVSKKEILIVESKRFSYIDKKSKEITYDITRINNFKKFGFDRCPEQNYKRIDDLTSYTIYGVILADIWVEKIIKPKIRDSFKDNNFVDVHLSLEDNYKKQLKGLTYFVKDFSAAEIENNPHKKNTIKQDYNLLAFMWKVQEPEQEAKNKL